MKARLFLSALTVAMAAASASALPTGQPAEDAPRYIFYFIGDGMGHGQVMAADLYYRQVLGNDTNLPMTQLPVSSFATTYSYSSPVTDSAAAGTALATGTKTRNGMLGMNADTIAVNSVAHDLHNMGYGVAILTTVAADDATPGAFYSHVPRRSRYADVARQIADADYELVSGAALRGFTDKNGNDTGARKAIEDDGIVIVYGTDALDATTAERVVMLPDNPTWDWNVGYTVDASSNPGAMTLTEMLPAAIRHLQRLTPDAFFIMAEGGNIDHAGHANDAGAAIKEVITFNNAIEEALKFYAEHPDETLIVITADHETGGMTVGNIVTGYNCFPQYVEPQNYSKERFSVLCDELMQRPEKPTWEEVRQLLTDALGFFTVVPITPEQEQRLQEVYELTFIEGQGRRQETLYANFNQFAVEAFEMLNSIAGFGWTTTHHTGNPVPVYAIGVGAEQFAGCNDNTSIPTKIRQITGVTR